MSLLLYLIFTAYKFTNGLSFDEYINLGLVWQEVEQATDVMNALQGSTLPSSDRGGMHIE